MNIFRAYDIRGEYPSEINEDIAYKIGRAFVQHFNVDEVVIGRDGRNSSPAISNAVIHGMTDQGAKVTDIGQCTTPALYFASAFYEFPAGIMITASHLGGKSNGLKFCLDNARPIDYDSGIKIMEQLVNENRFKESEKGIVEHKDIGNDYNTHLNKFIDNIKGLKVVVDFSNGVEKKYWDRIEEGFNDCNIIKINEATDGDFPAHEPNPAEPENLSQLAQAVRDAKADIGIMFDGDSDRAGFVDQNGDPIPGDLVTLLIALSYPDKDGEAVVYDINSGKVVKEVLEKHNKVPVISATGQNSMKALMRKNNAFMGGEFSGHYTFKDNFYSDSGIIAAVRVLSIVSNAKNNEKTFSDIVNPFKKYFSTGQVNLTVTDKDGKMKEIEDNYRDAKNITKIDGIFVEYDDWWFKLRKSNTEDILRLNVEAKTKELMDMKKSELIELIKG